MQVTLANRRAAPFNRWSFHHVRELIPSADIPHDPARARAARPSELDAERITETVRAAAGLRARLA